MSGNGQEINSPPHIDSYILWIKLKRTYVNLLMLLLTITLKTICYRFIYNMGGKPEIISTAEFQHRRQVSSRQYSGSWIFGEFGNI